MQLNKQVKTEKTFFCEDAVPNNKSRSGFTLVEMAIAMMVVGIVLAAFAVPYSLYLKKQKAATTETNITLSTKALTDYLSIQGHYPCPARRDLARTDPNYGRETDCTNTSIPPGTCADGICIEENTRTIIEPVTNTPVTIVQRVRVGHLPFRQMNMDEGITFDGYDMRYKYAVTEELAIAGTFDPARGGIEILNDNNASILTPPMSGHYIIISSGPDRKGGFTRDNVQIACDTDERQTENCNIDTPAVYRNGTYSTADGLNKFDDTVSFFSADAVPLWRISNDPAATPHDIEQIPTNGGIQFMNATANAPDAPMMIDEIQIAGAIQSSGTPTEEGQMRIDRLCNNPAGATPLPETCFNPAIIASPTASALECPAGQVAREVAHNQLGCVPITDLRLECTGATPYVQGVRADGTLICAGAPVIACPAETKVVCPSEAPISLPPGVANQVFNSSASIISGFCRKDKYRCQAGRWVHQGVAGSCVQYQYNNNAACAEGFTGARDMRRTYNCSSMGWGSYVLNPATGAVNTCVCDVNATKRRSISCPAGFSGSAFITQKRLCSPNQWQDIPGTEDYSGCGCTPSGVLTDKDNCPDAQVGDITTRYQYQCIPGRTRVDLGTVNTCTCDTSRLWETKRDCPAGETGEIIDTRSVIALGCTWGAPVTVNNCQPVPPPKCTWKNNDTTNQIDDIAHSLNQVGSGTGGGTECTCGSTGKCYEKVADRQFKNFTHCSCE